MDWCQKHYDTGWQASVTMRAPGCPAKVRKNSNFDEFSWCAETLLDVENNVIMLVTFFWAKRFFPLRKRPKPSYVLKYNFYLRKQFYVIRRKCTPYSMLACAPRTYFFYKHSIRNLAFFENRFPFDHFRIWKKPLAPLNVGNKSTSSLYGLWRRKGLQITFVGVRFKILKRCYCKPFGN